MLNLHYGLIHQDLSAQIDLTEENLPSIRDGYLPTKYELCREGDVIFADASEDTNDVGKVVEFINCDKHRVISGLHTIHGRDKLSQTIVGFKGFAFSAKPFRTQIRVIAQGTKVYSISPKSLQKCFVTIPEDKEEQQTIVNMLSKINKKISVEKKVLFRYEIQKDFLLKKMFM